MDLRSSPYTPGAGVEPAVLAGCEEILDRFDVALDRLEAGKSAHTPLITGSRGSGKTVLFNTLLRRARDRGWFVGAEEALPGTPLSALIAILSQDVLMQMSSRHRFAERVKRALGILKAFSAVSVAGVSLEINTEAVTGTADTGILELDLRRLFVEIGEIAKLQSIGVIFALDEAHTLDRDDFSIIDSALHGTAQRQLPVAFLGAGLFPSWQPSGNEELDPSITSSYAARSDTLSYVRLDPLSFREARAALLAPAESEGVSFTEEALNETIQFCQGNPWLIQFTGEAAWEVAKESPVTANVMREALRQVQDRLDQSFFPRLLRNCNADEIKILAGIAEAGGRDVQAPCIPRPEECSEKEFNRTIANLARQDLLVIKYRRRPLRDNFSLTLSVPRLTEYLKGP
ncbi:ATP-binding protein [Streptomyces sp. CA-210063]|uniref:ATP-binding protein n=1 Tax=Streptomyces sp. CA-210063 TaxID=2801029 RepID=UPI00214CBAD7|nr:ATP-binding protein [Streptomyces sp. CA-210063]UUU30901.1 ATP-binding protein [Streptomyces sp. CA-210063]